MPRYEITGEWSGYHSHQRRVCHREYTTDKEFADKVRDLGFIRYTDGTTLDIRMRQLRKGERRQPEVRGYSSLIRDCVKHDTNSVADLPAERD